MTPNKLKKQANVVKSLELHKSNQKNVTTALCKELTKEKDLDDWAESLWEFQEAYAKILYSELSVFIIEESHDNVIQTIETNIENISQYMDSTYTKMQIEPKHYEFWLKFRDHCKLAILQRRHYNISKTTIEDLTSGIVKTETDRIQKDLTSQLIGLVSIFTALSFVIFGGINILNSVLQNVQLASISRLICVGLLWTICMSILFYVFVRFILKIIKPEEKNVLSEDFMNFFKGLIIGLSLLLIGTVLLDIFYYNPIQRENKEQNPEIIYQPEEVIIHDLSE